MYKKKRNKSFYAMLAFMIAALICIPTALQLNTSAAKKITPQMVTLRGTSSPAYNKITIQWNKVKDATHYKIYYKQAGTSKWKYVATTGASKNSYTHISNKKAPIVVGQKYTYTVKAYNKKHNTTAKYNTKGVTQNTIPSTVKVTGAKLNSSKDAVNVTWNKTNSCDTYGVFRKTSSSSWQRIATIKNKNVTSFTDTKPLKGKKNIYTVRSYYSKTRTWGKYNYKGVSASVPNTPKPPAVVKVESVKLNRTSLTFTRRDESYMLTASVAPANATNKFVEYSSSNSSVATVSVSGNVTAVGNGTATITATAKDGSGKKATCRVKVDIPGKIRVKEVKMATPYTITLTKDHPSYQLKANVFPKNASNKDLVWDVNLIEGIQVDKNGKISIKKEYLTRNYYEAGSVNATSVDNPNAWDGCTVIVNVVVENDPTTSKFPEEVLRLTNIERAKRGLQPLKYHDKVQKAAMIRAKELEVLFEHQRPNGQDAITALWQMNCGGATGENIGKGARTAEEMMHGWMNSGGHRGAILDPDARYMGVGFHIGSDGTYYWVQAFADEPDTLYSMMLDTSGGNPLPPVKAHKGEPIEPKDVPTPVREGYKFDGWYINRACTMKFEGAYMNQNDVIYAKWIPA